VLYKNDFAPAAGILKLLAPALVVMGVNHGQMQILIALNRESQLMKGALILCLSNAILACVFLPLFGVFGTCYALLGSELANFIFLRFTLRSLSSI
jgi:O-antigen/teichoic acid export membrane protein